MKKKRLTTTFIDYTTGNVLSVMKGIHDISSDTTVNITRENITNIYVVVNKALNPENGLIILIKNK